MPRVRPLTQAQRDAQDMAERTERNKRIISTAAKASGRGMQDVAAALGLKPVTLYARIERGNMRVADFVKLADLLSLDDQTRARICGSKTKCRWETDYMDGTN